jgi:pimeloyl-ACP methyl ester carboxylesterase
MEHGMPKSLLWIAAWHAAITGSTRDSLRVCRTRPTAAWKNIVSQGIVLLVFESGRGLPLLCLHGMWGDLHLFDDGSRELSSSFRLLTMALRGHGRSEITTMIDFPPKGQ